MSMQVTWLEQTRSCVDFCNKGFEMSESPFVCSLDKALGAINIYRQAYYGLTFISNHVHKCLKISNYNHTQIITFKIYRPFFVHTLCTGSSP